MLYLTKFKNSRGQGVVEFALMLPIILFLLIVIIEAGFLLSAYVQIQNVSRETARQIAVHTSEGAIEAVINGRFRSIHNVTSGSFVYTYTYTSSSGAIRELRQDAVRGDTATVTFTIEDYEPLIRWTGLVIPEELSARSVMMIEN